MAKVVKSLHGNRNNDIALLKNSSSDPLGTVELLMRTHFPGSTDCQMIDATEYDGVDLQELLEDETLDFVTDTSVAWAFRQFQGDKAPGLDGIRTSVMKILPFKFKTFISVIYRAILKLAYTPLRWREAKVVYSITVEGGQGCIHPESGQI